MPPVLTALAVLAGCSAAEEPRPPVGQRCEYQLRIWKGAPALGITVGSVVMELRHDTYQGSPCKRFRVRTRARCLGYDVDAVTDSYVTPDLRRELFFRYLRTGSRRVESKLLFHPSAIEYRRVVPSEDAGDGQWRTLARHPYEPGVCDMFAALYLAPVGNVVPAGEPSVVRCVADRKLWDIAFRAVARETITVPAGTFEVVELELGATAANEHTRSLPFRGPFALGPDTRLWVDPSRRLLVRLEGTAHLVLPVRAEMRLVRVSGLDVYPGAASP
ncbi:MAG: DUF3108 domain-containing protein [Candidatus Brocadiia bacterium]